MVYEPPLECPDPVLENQCDDASNPDLTANSRGQAMSSIANYYLLQRIPNLEAAEYWILKAEGLGYIEEAQHFRLDFMHKKSRTNTNEQGNSNNNGGSSSGGAGGSNNSNNNDGSSSGRASGNGNKGGSSSVGASNNNNQSRASSVGTSNNNNQSRASSLRGSSSNNGGGSSSGSASSNNNNSCASSDEEDEPNQGMHRVNSSISSENSHSSSGEEDPSPAKRGAGKRRDWQGKRPGKRGAGKRWRSSSEDTPETVSIPNLSPQQDRSEKRKKSQKISGGQKSTEARTYPTTANTENVEEYSTRDENVPNWDHLEDWNPLEKGVCAVASKMIQTGILCHKLGRVGIEQTIEWFDKAREILDWFPAQSRERSLSKDMKLIHGHALYYKGGISYQNGSREDGLQSLKGSAFLYGCANAYYLLGRISDARGDDHFERAAQKGHNGAQVLLGWFEGNRTGETTCVVDAYLDEMDLPCFVPVLR